MIQIFEETLRILNNLNVSDDVLLIGTWVEYLYEQYNIVDNFIGNIRTKDIDFLIKNIRKPTNPVDLFGEFLKHGYLVNVSGFDVYKLIKEDFEIEFLALMKGGNYSYIKAPKFKIPKVETLYHIDMLIEDVVAVTHNNISISIPNPYNYILHKIIINEYRKIEKKEKDRRAILNLLIYLDTDKDKEKFSYYFENVITEKERLIVKNYICKNGLKTNFDAKMTK